MKMLIDKEDIIAGPIYGALDPYLISNYPPEILAAYAAGRRVTVGYGWHDRTGRIVRVGHGPKADLALNWPRGRKLRGWVAGARYNQLLPLKGARLHFVKIWY